MLDVWICYHRAFATDLCFVMILVPHGSTFFNHLSGGNRNALILLA